jgi:group I intron endonuclease
MELSSLDKNKKMVVYCIENKLNNKKYIGITKNSLNSRINGHKYRCRLGSKTAIYDAIRALGGHNFSIYILKECESEQDLINSEIYFINELKTSTDEHGYNILTDKYIFSKARTGKKNTKKHKKKLSQRMHSLKSEYIKLHEKEWVIVNPHGAIFYIKNLQKFCRENSLDAPNMVKQTTFLTNGLYKGWQCFKKEDFSKDKIKEFFNGVKIYFDNGEIETFMGSIALYARKNNYDNSCLQKLRKGLVNKCKKIIKIENIKL